VDILIHRSWYFFSDWRCNNAIERVLLEHLKNFYLNIDYENDGDCDLPAFLLFRDVIDIPSAMQACREFLALSNELVIEDV